MIIDALFTVISNVISLFLNILPGINDGIDGTFISTIVTTARPWGELIPVNTCITLLGYITLYWIGKLLWTAMIFVYGKIPIIGH